MRSQYTGVYLRAVLQGIKWRRAEWGAASAGGAEEAAAKQRCRNTGTYTA